MERVSFLNNRGQRLYGNLFHAKNAGGTGVLFSHGLFSSKDGYKINRMADAIAAEGYDLLAFDFSFTGESGGDMTSLSVLQEIEDLRCAAGFFVENVSKNIHFIGSSMGAAVSILYLSESPAEALSLAGIATPADLRGLITGNTSIKNPGSLPAEGRTELQGIMIKNSFFREIDAINMAEAMERITVPVLAIHGGRDIVVPPSNVEILERHILSSFKKVIIGDGDHNLVRDSDINLIRDELLSWFSSHTCPE